MWCVDISCMCIRYVEKEHLILYASSKHEQICLAGVVTGCSWVITCLVRVWICYLTKSAKWLNHSICEMTDWKLTQNNMLLKDDWPQLTLPALLLKPQATYSTQDVWNYLETHLPVFPLPAACCGFSLHSPKTLNCKHNHGISVPFTECVLR